MAEAIPEIAALVRAEAPTNESGRERESAEPEQRIYRIPRDFSWRPQQESNLRPPV